MKKFLLLGLGFTFLLSAMIFIPQASRDTYHAYLKQQMFERQKNRRATANFRVGEDFTAKNSYRNQANIRVQDGQLVSERKSLRSFSRRFSTPTNQIQTSPTKRKFVTRAHTRLPNNWETFETQDYTLKVPHNVTIIQTTDDISFSKQAVNLHTLIQKMDEKNCTGNNFALCARGITRTTNRKNDRNIEQLVQRTNGTRPHLVNSTDQKQFYLESAVTNGVRGDEFVTQRILEGTDGETYLIEVAAPKDKAHYTIPFANRIFQTLHLK